MYYLCNLFPGYIGIFPFASTRRDVISQRSSRFVDNTTSYHQLRHLFHSKNICPLLFLIQIKVNICPLPLPHFASIFFAYLWSFRWPNYIVTLPRYFSFRLPHLNIPTRPPSDEWTRIFSESHFLFFSHWNEYNHFRFVLDFSYAFGIL